MFKHNQSKKTDRNGFWLFGLIVLTIALLFLFPCLRDTKIPRIDAKIFAGLSLQVISLLVTWCVFWLIIKIFGKTNFKEGAMNFLIGDDGTYSLGRLQALVWAVVIISVQLSELFALTFNKGGNLFHLYQPVFSESAMWLLGLSLSSYIAVKQITLDKAAKAPRSWNYHTEKGKWEDILMGENGLDFSRCQMLLWTILAIAVFLSKSYLFNQELLFSNIEGVNKVYNNFFEEYNQKLLPSQGAEVFVPYLPWSFVVLMGLSQGAYIAKKLVPTFKWEEVKALKMNDLNSRLKEIEDQKEDLAEILAMSAKGVTQLDLLSKEKIESKITILSDQANKIASEISEIEGLLNQ
ncbi:hypothetical protein HQN86_24765 [Pedobacter panaciterrae]|uniref:hypothetical protein n=1 Tax=Pedobacter panaciterrae TaxID=363849 RepID=UPI00155DC867|nr:hypothetical protein [Pedobacter panaciterrae]NQX56853.1 hypothetical protein [Pedobacter panaciterrae]